MSEIATGFLTFERCQAPVLRAKRLCDATRRLALPRTVPGRRELFNSPPRTDGQGRAPRLGRP